MQIPEDTDENNIKAPFLELNQSTAEYSRENWKTKDSTVAWQLACIAANRKFKKREPEIIETSSDDSILDLFKTPRINHKNYQYAI